MELILLIILIILVISLIVIFLIFNRKKSDDPSMTMLNQNIQGMHKRLDNAAKVMGDVNKELGQVQEMGRQMKDLQDFLKSPKLRGNIGEQVLKDLLNQYFPQKYFDLQFKFKTGQIVDAILRTDQGLISLDSKFPLENFSKMAKSDNEAERKVFLREFTKDVRKHIRDIARKYILPEEGTVDFAIMYVPSEAIYYEIIRNDIDLQTHAQEKKVLLVSPNSFYYFLKVILMGMQGQKIEEASKKMMEMFQAVGRDTEKFGEELGVMGRHLTNAKGSYERLEKGFNKLTDRVDQVKLIK